ncbi:unnamed protein product [Ambrosiozyma monospora]|uniref:ethanolamine kinase n=1 Tax=Ambrosiozyma monospora TaxID=43982 RepID=A0A9W7DH64_AMBMO|nr:unnamed protein product [Ambrosiozyma monospora]
MNPSHSMSTYCLISNGDLHFLPYNHNHNNHIPHTSDTTTTTVPNENENETDNDCSYPLQQHTKFTTPCLYSSFLNSKTVSSLSATPNVASYSGTGISISSSSLSDLSIDEEGADSQVAQLLNNYCTHAIYLPDYYIEPSNPIQQSEEIKKMLFKIFPHWNSNDHVQITRLTGGITNMLLECTRTDNSNPTVIEKVLVRTYGRGTNLIIDRDREFVSQLVINSVGLAPPIHARFGNGLVYGYISGRSLDYDELSSPLLYPLIASKLGQWHSAIKLSLIDDSLSKLKKRFHDKSTPAMPPKCSDLWSLTSHWIEICPEIEGLIKVCNDNKDIQQLMITHTTDNKNNNSSNNNNNSVRSILKAELDWVQSQISSKSPVVASHSDLLSGNIIIPNDISEALQNGSEATENLLNNKYSQGDQSPINFIDYEYMIKAPRAFDISNHFMEWQGFNCDKDLIPKPDINNKVMRIWCLNQ